MFYCKSHWPSSNTGIPGFWHASKHQKYAYRRWTNDWKKQQQKRWQPKGSKRCSLARQVPMLYCVFLLKQCQITTPPEELRYTKTQHRISGRLSWYIYIWWDTMFESCLFIFDVRPISFKLLPALSQCLSIHSLYVLEPALTCFTKCTLKRFTALALCSDHSPAAHAASG